MVENIQYLPSLGKSDHIILQFQLNCYIEKPTTKTEKLAYNKGDYESLTEKLSNCNWEELLQGDISSYWRIFTERIYNFQEQTIPKSNVRPQKLRNPFVDRVAIEAINTKRKKWTKYQNCKNLHNYNTYKEARNKVNYELRRSRYEYEKRIASNSKNNPKCFWKFVRGNMHTAISTNHLFKPNGIMTIDDREIAETLNNHFISVFTDEDLRHLPEFSINKQAQPIPDR